MVEKFVLKSRVHLGFVRDTFNAGTTLDVDEEKGVLLIDGVRKFNEVRDIQILKRNGMVVPFSEDAVAQYRGTNERPKQEVQPGKKPPLEVVQSDVDLSETIDISDTQVAKNRVAAEEARKAKIAKEGMEVIRGDETAEERQASQAAEKVVRGLPVVQDDSLGREGGSVATALNAGQKVLSREEIEAKTEAARAAAEARKLEAQKAREKAVEEGRLEGLPEDEPPVEGATAEAAEKPASQSSELEELKAANEQLRQQNAQLSSQMGELLEQMKEITKPKRGPGRPKGSKNKKTAKKVVKKAKKPAEAAPAMTGGQDGEV